MKKPIFIPSTIAPNVRTKQLEKQPNNVSKILKKNQISE